MFRTVARAAWLTPLLVSAACVASDPPLLSLEDLVEVPAVAGHFVPPRARDALAKEGGDEGWVEINRLESGAYTFMHYRGLEGDRGAVWNSGNQIQLLPLAEHRYLMSTIYWSPLFEGNVLFFLDVQPDGTLQIDELVLDDAAKDPEFVAEMRLRHDVGITFESELEDDSGVRRTRIEGQLQAARLRALFNDPVLLDRLVRVPYKTLRPLRA